MKIKRQSGFTLLEVMVAIPVAVIVLLAVGMVLYSSNRSWNEAWKKANLLRDASYAMLKISCPIKAATSAQLEGDGTAVKIYREGGWIRFFFTQSTGSLQYEVEGQTPKTIIDEKVENVQFNVEGNKITIDLQLEEDDLQTHFVSTVMMRNYGG